MAHIFSNPLLLIKSDGGFFLAIMTSAENVNSYCVSLEEYKKKSSKRAVAKISLTW